MRPTRYARERARCSGRQAAKQLHRNHRCCHCHCLTTADPLFLIDCLCAPSIVISIHQSIKLSINQKAWLSVYLSRRSSSREELAPPSSSLSDNQRHRASTRTLPHSLAASLSQPPTHPASQPWLLLVLLRSPNKPSRSFCSCSLPRQQQQRQQQRHCHRTAACSQARQCLAYRR